MHVVFFVTESALSFLLGFTGSSDFDITEGSFHWKVFVEILDFLIGFNSLSLLIYFKNILIIFKTYLFKYFFDSYGFKGFKFCLLESFMRRIYF